MHRQLRKGGRILATTESTNETTKADNPAGPPGGRPHTYPGQVRRIHRCKRILRRKRSAQAPVQEGRGVQALVSPTHQQSQPRTNPRRRTYEDCVATNEDPSKPIRYA